MHDLDAAIFKANSNKVDENSTNEAEEISPEKAADKLWI